MRGGEGTRRVEVDRCTQENASRAFRSRDCAMVGSQSKRLAELVNWKRQASVK
jgi:hypothetical protein